MHLEPFPDTKYRPNAVVPFSALFMALNHATNGSLFNSFFQTAILDRFLHHAEIITITGRSYRLKDRAGSESTDKNKPQKDDGDNSNELSA